MSGENVCLFVWVDVHLRMGAFRLPFRRLRSPSYVVRTWENKGGRGRMRHDWQGLEQLGATPIPAKVMEAKTTVNKSPLQHLGLSSSSALRGKNEGA